MLIDSLDELEETANRRLAALKCNMEIRFIIDKETGILDVQPVIDGKVKEFNSLSGFQVLLLSATFSDALQSLVGHWW